MGWHGGGRTNGVTGTEFSGGGPLSDSPFVNAFILRATSAFERSRSSFFPRSVPASQRNPHDNLPFSLKCLDPGSAGKSRRYDMASAQIPVFLSEKPSTDNGQFRVAN